VVLSQRHWRLLWLVEHRELQLRRALATNQRAYIAERERKLAAARARLHAYEARKAAA
jgi:hypothetical protein